MKEKDMQHGLDWDGQNVAGYIATEKYNGCRGYWDGYNLYSKRGRKINLPDSWRAALPEGIELDAEVYDGPDGLYRVGGAFRTGRFTPTMRLIVFDCPGAKGNYQARLNEAKKYENALVKVVSCKIVKNLSEAKALLRGVLARKGEGLMLRHPGIKYTPGRTAMLLKFKECCLATDALAEAA